MDKKTLEQLKKISKPKAYKKDEYICYEGQPGNEMFIVLKGCVGVNITNAMGLIKEIARIECGNFFGEMAIFDNFPRSASCIALEDSVCVAINKNNLELFLVNCPELAMKMLENMSQRIRKLNNELYKTTDIDKKSKIMKFVIPEEYSFKHIVKEPYQENIYYEDFEAECPICNKSITLKGLRKNIMQIHSINRDGRIKYFRCDPLWHEVQKCSHCNYSNHYINFFKLNKDECNKIDKLLKEEHNDVVKVNANNRTLFDNVVISYLQAIHINEHIRQGDNAFIGMLWMKLYWLAYDSGDDKFTNFCALNAMAKLKMAIDIGEENDINNRCYMALLLASLCERLGMKSEILQYSSIAIGSSDKKIKELARTIKKDIVK